MMPNKYFLGLDLGQAADYSALAILEAQGQDSAREYHCRHLQRWPLKTPYPAIVADTAKIIRSEELKGQHCPVLAIDATGVGAPVVDLFKEELKQVRGRGANYRPASVVDLFPIQITGGDQVTHEGGFTRIPKRDLVSTAQVALQSERLKVSTQLSEAEILTKELQNFQVKISLDTAHDSYGAWREGTHDDLVLAVCLALWQAEKGVDRTMYVFSYSGVSFGSRVF
jgi:hypothetical protein